MAQVDTHSAFRHSSQHSQYYYPSASPSRSTTSSPSNSHHSSPRNPTVHPQRYYSPSQHCSPEDKAYHYRNYEPPPPSTIEQPDESNTSPFPAYDHAISSQNPTPEPIEDEEGEEEEEDYDELEDDLVDSSSVKSASSSVGFPHVSDDIWTERGPAPSRQVDYLSYDWQEPDIWSSWRYIRKEKGGYLQNAARLENASWRTWAKSKYKLKTITPETLNWLKDCDVTWLYGPLQSQVGTLARAHTEPTSPAISELSTPRREMSRSSSFSTPSKPILKKRSHSEVMLTSFAAMAQENLLARAAQAIQDERQREMEEREFQEEQRRNPLTPTHVLRSQQRIRRTASTDLPSLPRESPESPVNPRPDYFGTNWISSSSGGQTPSASKHIHFNDRVEQYIAVDIKDYEDSTAIDESESEDEILCMKSRHPPKIEHSTIAKLPATKLRPGDEPIREPPQVAFDLGPTPHEDASEASGFYYAEGGGFSSSASPPEFPPRFDEDPIDDFSFDPPFTLQSTSDSIPSNTSSTSSSRRSSDFNLEEESAKRASVSAIPIPIGRSMSPRDHGGMMGEEDDEGIGIVGFAADAISTAKDLVGVLWNAGWGARR